MKKYIEIKVISAEPAAGPMGFCGYTVKSADGRETWVSDEDFESTCHAIDDGMAKSLDKLAVILAKVEGIKLKENEQEKEP